MEPRTHLVGSSERIGCGWGDWVNFGDKRFSYWSCRGKGGSRSISVLLCVCVFLPHHGTWHECRQIQDWQIQDSSPVFNSNFSKEPLDSTFCRMRNILFGEKDRVKAFQFTKRQSEALEFPADKNPISGRASHARSEQRVHYLPHF